MPEAEAVFTIAQTDAVSDMDQPRSAVKAAPSTEVFLYGRPVQVQLTRAARTAAAGLAAPLIVEMELYFSCLVRKAMRFHPADKAPPAGDGEHAPITDRLVLRFRPVTTEHCALPDDDSAPPLETMPVKRPQDFLPRWIEIDFRHGEWRGEFGY